VIRRQRSGTRPSWALRSSVENELQKLLPHGKANRQTVARALGMSERTLSRRLADERTTYEELGDQLRRSLALQYIRAPSISVSQIAWLLGYEGSTLFSHAFARWTGRSPSAVRKDEKLPAPAERQKEIGEFGVAMPVPRAWSRHKPTPPAREHRTK
jgi:AraC-like DNA-binding protein